MIISHVDISHTAAQRERLTHVRNPANELEKTALRESLSSCSGSVADKTGIDSLLTVTRLRKRSSAALALHEQDNAEVESEYCCCCCANLSSCHRTASDANCCTIRTLLIALTTS